MLLIMMGTGDFAVPTFRALLDRAYQVPLLVTQPDRPQGRHQRLVPAPIKQLAIERGIDVFQPDRVNDTKSVARLAALQPDLFVVAAYGQILSDELLHVPRLGGVNLHAALLPKYRGAAPVNWAIFHGETTTGVTVIRMTPRVDAGSMLLQAETPIEPDETAGALELRLAELGAPLVCRAIDGLADGSLVGLPQDRSRATRAPKLNKEHGLIDWSRSASAVCDQIRAMQPWPMAYSYLHPGNAAPERIIIEAAAAETGPSAAQGPGIVSETAGDRLVVAAGAGQVRLLRLRPAGKRSMTVEEFLRGRRIGPASRFGPE